MKEYVVLLSEFIGVFREWLAKSDDRRTRAFKRAVWDYIDTDEDESLSDERKAKLKKHYRRRIKSYQ